MNGSEKGAHEWMIEFKHKPENITEFTELLDNALKALNSDYEAKRLNNMTLNLPKLHVAKPQLFYNWLRENDKLGGQNKIPRLSNSRDFIENLIDSNHRI